jgi:acyl carrier protein
MSNAQAEAVKHPELLAKLMEVTAEALKVETVDPGVPLSEIGIDSLNIIDIIMASEEIYSGFQIDPSKLEFDEMTSLMDIHNQMISFDAVP